MDFKCLLKQLKATEWWTEECPASPQILFPVLEGFAHTGNCIGLTGIHSIVLYIHKDGLIVEKTPSVEKQAMFERLVYLMQTNEIILHKIEKKWKKSITDAMDVVPQRLSNCSAKKLLTIYKQCLKKQGVFWSYGLIAEAPDSFSNDESERFASTTFGTDYHHKFLTAISAKKMSFLDRQTLSLLRLTEEYCRFGKPKVLPPRFRKKLQQHTINFFWIHVNYRNHTLRDEAYFLKEVLEEAEKSSLNQIKQRIKKIKMHYQEISVQKDEVFKRVKLTERQQSVISVVEWCGEMLDVRKEHCLQLMHHYYRLLEAIAQRTKIPYEEIRLMTPSETEQLLTGEEVLPKSKNTRAAYVAIDGKITLFFGKEADKIYDAVTTKDNNKTIKGIVVSLGKEKNVEGRCQVIFDVHNEVFVQGNVLVTTMTRPEFVPILKKASGLITDEGGLTCHAAIVAIELDIPCIVGTKIASKMLKDGQLVELNANHGVVRVLTLQN